jgi:hypothetical protein
MTRGRRLQTRLPYAALAAALLFAIGVALAVAAPAARAAAPAESAWRVVWIDGSRIYMATRDTLPIDPGQPVTFLQSRKTLASGEVEQMLDRTLAVVRLESGSLGRARKLDRIVVRLDPRTLAVRPVLRLGIAGYRMNALFACRSDTLLAPALGEVYRLQAGPGGALDLVHRAGAADARPWPDTMRVRRFDDAADQEIALARGEIDAAVFGPGVASAHLRGEPRWASVLYGARGALLARQHTLSSMPPGVQVSSRDLVALQTMGLDVLRGDLAWRVTAADPDAVGKAGWLVSPDCPAHDAMQRHLGAAGLGTFGIEYTADGTPPLGGRVLATVLCPIVSDAEWQPYLRALGPDVLARIFECAGGASRP